MARAIEDIGACSQTAVAEVLGVNRNTVAKWGSRNCPRNTDGTYCLSAVFAWRLDDLSASGEASELAAEQDADSPSLERYRAARADLAEHELAVRRGELIPRDEMMEVLRYCARVLRTAGEQLQKSFGRDAQELLNGALDEFEETIHGLSETDD